MRSLHLKWDNVNSKNIGHLYEDAHEKLVHRSLGTFYAKDDEQRQFLTQWFDAANIALQNVILESAQ